MSPPTIALAPALRIRPAASADAVALADLAERTFRDTFAAVNTPANVAAHISASYSPAKQLAEIGSPQIRTLLVEHDDCAIGYAQLRSGHTPECVTMGGAIELWHFYIDKAWLGCGVAQRLMESVFAEAAKLGMQAIWLGVWEHNLRAIAFYRKYGFHEVGAHVFHLGNDAQTDSIMVRDLV
ncbi:MAG TPA: GNAT family N-acetyltransferase [Rudaea sp.]|jgi:ribosomal protein S18 acetylase RimI-like enzyme|uniref:GNAT family N-acetyltransferase n=1 Tax=Rudaea sp. TaxID=2136325 RepID=UPI002F93E753